MYGDTFIIIVGQFDSIWDGHFASIWVGNRSLVQEVQYQVKLRKSKGRPLRLALYPTRPKARKLENQEIDRMLVIMDLIEIAQTECASPIEVVPKKDGNSSLLCQLQEFNRSKDS